MVVHGGSQRVLEVAACQAPRNLPETTLNLSLMYVCGGAVTVPPRWSNVCHNSPCPIPSCTHRACPGYEQPSCRADCEHTMMKKVRGKMTVLVVGKAGCLAVKTGAALIRMRPQPCQGRSNFAGISREHIVNSPVHYTSNLRDYFALSTGNWYNTGLYTLAQA